MEINYKKCCAIAFLSLVLALVAYSLANDAFNTNDVFNIVVNNTNKAPTFAGETPGTGERQNGVTYWTNESSIELFVWSHHESDGQFGSVELYINGTLVSITSSIATSSPTRIHKEINAIIPKGSNYKVNFFNIHHYEWREYPILSGKNGTLSINQTIIIGNGSTNITGLTNPLNQDVDGNKKNITNLNFLNVTFSQIPQPRGIEITNTINDIYSGSILLRHDRNGNAVQQGDSIGAVAFAGKDNVMYQEHQGIIQCWAAENYIFPTNYGTYCTLQQIKNGTGYTPYISVKFEDNGDIKYTGDQYYTDLKDSNAILAASQTWDAPGTFKYLIHSVNRKFNQSTVAWENLTYNNISGNALVQTDGELDFYGFAPNSTTALQLYSLNSTAFNMFGKYITGCLNCSIPGPPGTNGTNGINGTNTTCGSNLTCNVSGNLTTIDDKRNIFLGSNYTNMFSTQRGWNTTYTNNNGFPILVSISSTIQKNNLAGQGYSAFYINGIIQDINFVDGNQPNLLTQIRTFYQFVPPGASYILVNVTQAGTITQTINSWYENNMTFQ